MLIQCPRCSTGWRVPDTPPSDNPVFKCGRCHHLFRRFPGAPTSGERRVEASRRAEPPGDNLEFIFPTRPEEPSPSARTRPAEPAPPDDEAPGAPPVPDPGDEETAEPDDLADADFSFGDDDEREAATDPAEDEESPEGDKWTDDDEEPALPSHADARVLHPEDPMPRAHGFSTIVRPLAILVALHAILALTIRVAPDSAGAWLERLPLAGPLLGPTAAPARRVELRNVTGSFQELRNSRRVFVIAGEAVNHSPSTVERIEVEATLYGTDGEVDHKVVSTGNRTTLTDLSEPEIALLQRLDPRTIVGPGEASAFLIVFLEPPREVREFSSRVLSVRPTRAASSPSDRSGRRPGPVG